MNERLPYLREKTRQLTLSPGVYLMKNTDGEIIYVGKAKNLRNRVTSYFRENPDHTPKVAKMVSHVFDYDFIVTDTEYEALVLECSLIKQYTPKYNILLKDDKGYHYIKVSAGDYPRITAEKRKADDGSTYFGPYMSSFTAKQAVIEANKFFMLPTCNKKFPREFGKSRPCLNFYIKQCMGVCTGKISKETLKAAVKDAADYIRSGSSATIEQLTSEMEKAAENLDFERAALLRDRISAIKKAADTQKIVTQRKDTDVIASEKNGGEVCISVILYRNGRLFDKQTFFFGETENDFLSDFISQYYSDPRKIPREVLIDDETEDIELLERLLRERLGGAVTVSAPKRGEGLKLIALSKNNASEYLSLRVGRTGKELAALSELGKLLGMKDPPLYIEAYDISNLGSSSMVAGMIVFENGRPNKSAYKKFSIKENEGQNDVGCMREVLGRRFKHYLDDDSGDEGFGRLPDLILLDGGKGQVSAVEPLLREMGVNVPVFGMVKDNRHRTRAIATSGDEISVSDLKPAFFLLTRIQDEVHRFAITYQRSKHQKKSFEMDITSIKGIGEKKALKIYSKFKTKEALKAASVEEIAAAAGVNTQIAEEISEFLQNK